MVEFDFGEQGGGKKAFKTFEEFSAHCRERAAEWGNTPAAGKFLQPRNDNFATAFRQLERQWNTLAEQPAATGAGSPQETVIQHVTQWIAGTALVAKSSSAGALIHRYIEAGDRLRALGAILFYARTNKDELFREGTGRDVHEGTLAAWAVSEGLDREAAVKSRDALRRIVNDMRTREGELITAFEEAEKTFGTQLTAMSDAAEEQIRNFSEKFTAAETAIAQDREQWAAKWSELKDLHVNQLKMRAPVELWTKRAEEHESSAKKARTWTLRVGVVGLLGAVCWSAASAFLAELFFSFALVDGQPKLAAGTLRPTWIHELIFAASSTLLYLTLYLWTLRILVRSMLSEQHLAADARSRASMAHTYLALTENGAAEEADRAIVLASLFRPVTDGLVKDDALPLLSPASIISDKLSGK